MDHDPNESSLTGEGCPKCGARGKPVQPITLESLLTPPADKRFAARQGVRFCATADCEVVYYSPGELGYLTRQELRVPVWQKEQGPQRLVCYCFGHTDGEILEQVASQGTSAVPDEIAEKCREGLDRCDQKNPQGSCCLGNVRSVLRRAQREREQTRRGSNRAGRNNGAACCGREQKAPRADERARRPARLGAWATAGSLLSAVLASACCWLPLTLIAFGVSAGGVGAAFEAWRPWFLTAAAVLLSFGFYFTYLRKPRCEPGDACTLPSPRLRVFNQAMFWVSAALVGSFAFFPSYVTSLLGGTGEEFTMAPDQNDAAVTRELSIEGMTCEGCAANIRRSLKSVPGVTGARVRYAEGKALVRLDPETSVPDKSLLEAVQEAGYTARIVNPPSTLAER